MDSTSKDYVKWFRNSAPYINTHRGKTFVLMFSGDAVEHANFANIIHDIALLNSLGVKLILVHGARPQIESRCQLRGITPRFHNDLRVTDAQTLECVKDAAGSLRAHIEALLTTGLANSPMYGAQIRVCSGNFVIAKPMGIHDGVDFCNTGEVRRVDTEAINRLLQAGAIVLLSPIGYSPTGEVFNLSFEDVATQTAVALKADKIIALKTGTDLFSAHLIFFTLPPRSTNSAKLNSNTHALSASSRCRGATTEAHCTAAMRNHTAQSALSCHYFQSIFNFRCAAAQSRKYRLIKL